MPFGEHPELDGLADAFELVEQSGRPLVVRVDQPLHPANQRLADFFGATVVVTAEQLNLLGHPDLPEDLDLGPVQRVALRIVRELGTLMRDEAGALAHAHSGKHAADERCAFCAVDGTLLVESLLRRQLVERGADGAVQLPRPMALPADDLPEGF